MKTDEFAQLPEIATLYHAKRALKRICEANELAGFALLTVKLDGGAVSFEMVTSNWTDDPVAALDHLVETDRQAKAQLLGAIAPFRLAAEQQVSGLDKAVFLPLFCERARGAMLVAPKGKMPSIESYGELHLYTLYLFARLTGLLQPRTVTTSLAPREIECLRWSAAGKTSSEIAGIIGVSENTVNSYLSSAAQKMNAVNRVQTVAHAIRLGLLG
ncbi:transcriptional regulator [Aureimonas sp. SA4125]|nr:transcriptional regulator [Aureimonas sp. SA4125]